MIPHMATFLGIDLGGTKTAVCVGDEKGRLLASRRMPTEADLPPRQWRGRLQPLVDGVLQECGLSIKQMERIGLAVPGPMSVPRRSVLNPPNMPAWRDVPVGQWVEELTGRPTFINNDANAAGLAEYLFGEFRGTPDLAYLTLSTGLGAGIITGGHLVQGANDLGGEVGHFVLDPAGPPCPCGQRGCFEMYCGGRNVITQVRERLAGGASSLILDEAGGGAEDINVSAIARAAHRGDPLAQEFWERFLERLAQGVGIVVMCFNPSAIVMGTIAIHLGDRLLDPLRARLPRFAWPHSLEGLVIRPSALGTDIGELGSLALAIHGSQDAVAPHRRSGRKSP